MTYKFYTYTTYIFTTLLSTINKKKTRHKQKLFFPTNYFYPSIFFQSKTRCRWFCKYGRLTAHLFEKNLFYILPDSLIVSILRKKSIVQRYVQFITERMFTYTFLYTKSFFLPAALVALFKTAKPTGKNFIKKTAAHHYFAYTAMNYCITLSCKMSFNTILKKHLPLPSFGIARQLLVIYFYLCRSIKQKGTKHHHHQSNHLHSTFVWYTINTIFKLFITFFEQQSRAAAEIIKS